MYKARVGEVLKSLTVKIPIDGTYTLESENFQAFLMKSKLCGSDVCILVDPTNREIEKNDVLNYGGVESVAPKWFGSYKAWIVGVRMPELTVDGKNFESNLYAAKLSSSLPSWVFVVASPQSPHREFNGALVNMGQGLPLVYNEGKVYSIVFPEIEVMTTKPASNSTSETRN